MVNIKSFYKFIPLTFFATQSYIGSRLDQSGAEKFKSATEAQSNLLAELREHPINSEGGKAYWSNNVTSLKEPGANVIDRKILFDGSGIATLGAVQYGLGILSAPVSALPVIPYLATPVMAYSEYVREQNFKNVIDQYWKPSCDTANLQAKLKAADNVGNNYNPKEYANFISGAYMVETGAVLTEGATVVAGLFSKTLVKPAVPGDSDPTGSGFSKEAPAAAEAASELLAPALSEMVKDSAAPAATPGGVGRAFEYMANTAANTAAVQYAASAAVNAAMYAGYAAGRASALAEATTQAAVNAGITGQNLAIGFGAFTAGIVSVKTVDNLSPIADEVKSVAHALSDGAYTALGALAGARDSEIGAFVKAREEVRNEVMSGFLKAQFDKCAPEDSASVASTYTQGCGTSTDEIIGNLLAGADGCSYVA